MKLHFESIEVPSCNDPNKEKVLDRVASIIRKTLDSSMRIQIDMKRSGPNAKEEISSVNLMPVTRMIVNSSHESIMKTVDYYLDCCSEEYYNKKDESVVHSREDAPFAVRIRWSETTCYLPDSSEKLFVIDVFADKTMDKTQVLDFHWYYNDHGYGDNSTVMMRLPLTLNGEEAIMRDGFTLTELC
jgi:hypothetical protein